jgi:hypothetical protein
MNRCYASVRMMMAVAAGALFMSAIAGPASAQNVKWENIVGIVQAGNIVGSFTTPPSCPVPPATPVGVGCINGGGQPWTTLGGQAKVNLSNSKLEFEVRGLVLAGGNSIGTPDAITSVQGTLICIVGTATSNVILNTTSVPLSSTGDAQFSGSLGPIPTSCQPSNVAFLITIPAGRWIANGSVRSSGDN